MCSFRGALFTTTFFIAAALSSGGAFAQTNASGAVDCKANPSAASCASQEVVVTGSRIKRASLTSEAPISTISAEEIQDRGITNLADIINEIPATGPGITPIGNQNDFAIGRNYIDLFGLGSNRTLTLVNGQRFVGDNAPASIFGVEGGNQVDLNELPTLFVDHIETVLATGAAVYGSDAVSGVVNVIMKKKFEGMEVEGSYGTSTYGDAPHYNFEGAIGHDFLDGKLNVALDFEYDRTNELSGADRPWTAAAYGFVPNPNSGPGEILVTNSRFSGVTAGGLPFQLDGMTPIYLPNASGGLSTTIAQFGKNGNLVPFNPGTVYGPLIGGTASGGDSLDVAAITSLQTVNDRKVADFISSYEFSPHLHANANIIYTDTESVEPANQPNYSALAFGGSPAFNEPLAGPALLISPNNAFLTPQAQAVLAANGVGAGGFYLSRANTDISPDPINAYVHTLNATLGLDGDFSALQRKFDWNLSYSRGQSYSGFNQYNIVYGNPAYNVPDLFGYALDSIIGPNGQPECAVKAQATTPASAYVTNCVPFDPFGVGNNNKAALNYFTAPFGQRALNQQDDFLANIGTSLYKLPAGDLQMTVGYEYRREKASFTPDLASAEGLGYSIPLNGQIGAYESNELYFEGLLPILSPSFNFPFLYRLELDGGFRYTNNSLAGSNNSWQFGGRFQPIPDITLRGSRSDTFRTPSLDESFAASTQAYDSGADPCQASNITSGPNPAVRQKNCAAAFAALGANLSGFTFSDVGAFTIPITASGNPQLKNETSENYTYGILLQPRFAPGLAFSIDYVHINITNAIEYFGIGSILESCYDSPSYPNTATCQDFTRNSQGQVVSANETYENAGFEHFVSVIYDLSYERNINQLPLMHIDRDLGRVMLDFNATNIHSEISSFSGLGYDDINYAGTIGTPRWRWKTSVGWQGGPVKVEWIAQYIGPSAYNLTYTSANQLPLNVHQSLINDLSINYTIMKGLKAYLNIDDIFNAGPPIGAETAIGNYYDYMGRYFTMGISKKF